MKSFFALFHARNLEFIRDKGALAWALLFPVLLIFGCAIAFSGQQPALFKVGLHAPHQASQNILQADYIEIFEYQDLALAKQRIKHHQLDLLISENKYWLNPDSQGGKVLKALLLQQAPELQEQTLAGKSMRYVDWVIPGVLGMNIMFGALFGVGYVVVRYRKMGVLKRFQATPLNAFQFLLAQIFSRLFVLMTATCVLFVGSHYLLDFMVLGSYIDLLITAVLGTLCLISTGLLISARSSSEELAGGLLNAMTWPMMFLSGVWFSLDNAPIYMRWLADCLPLTHLVAAARAIMLDGANLMQVAHHLAILAIMTLVFMAIASFSFKWSKN